MTPIISHRHFWGECLSTKFEKPYITPFSIRPLWEPRGPLCRMLASMNNLYTPLSCSKLLAVSIIEMAGARFSLSQTEVNLYEVGFLRHLYGTSPRVLVWVWWYHVQMEESRTVPHKEIWHCHAQNAKRDSSSEDFLASKVTHTSTNTHEQSGTVFFFLKQVFRHTRTSVNTQLICHATIQAKVLETPVWSDPPASECIVHEG